MCRVNFRLYNCLKCALRTEIINDIEKCPVFEAVKADNEAQGLSMGLTCSKRPVAPTFYGPHSSCASCNVRKLTISHEMLEAYAPLMEALDSTFKSWHVMEDAANDVEMKKMIAAAIGYTPDEDTWKHLLESLRRDHVEAVEWFTARRGEISKALDAVERHGQERDLLRYNCVLMFSLYLYPSAIGEDWMTDAKWCGASNYRKQRQDFVDYMNSLASQDSLD